MNSKFLDLVKQLRGAFNATRLELSQFEDSEGHLYQYSVLEVGAEVFEATAEGSIPASDGVYEVDAYTTIKVEGGKISEIEVKEEEVEESLKEEVEVVSDLDAFKAVLRSRLADTGKFSEEEVADLLEYEESLEELVEEVAETEEEEELFSEVVEGIVGLVADSEAKEKEIQSLKESYEKDLSDLKEEIESLKEGFSALVDLPLKPSKVKELESDKNPTQLSDIFSKLNK